MAHPVDVYHDPVAQANFGLSNGMAESGVGLETFGFLWACSAIWTRYDDPDRVTTWTDWSDGAYCSGG